MKHKKAATRLTALLLVAALCASLMIESNLAGAASYESLEHIETIKNEKASSGTPFTIVELTPQAGTGSIGYYVKGQEPTANWQTVLASTEGSTARKAYADKLFTSLRDAGLLSSGTDTPLKSSVSYTETLPWVTRPAGAQTIALLDQDGQPRTENAAEPITGTFSYQGANQGSFNQNSTPTLLPGATGDYQQSIQHFVYTAADTSTDGSYYYYQPVFAQLDLSDLEANEASYMGKAMYETITVTEPMTPGSVDTQTIPAYEYKGTLGDTGFSLDADTAYYYVTDTAAPSAVRDAAHPYRAVSSGFEPVANGFGYFTMTISGYVYVGDGKGSYAYSASGNEKFPVAYSQIYVTGGYSNNNWFLNYVLDESDTNRFSIQVISVTPQDLLAGKVTVDQLATADLLVLSAGFDPTSPMTSLVNSYTGGNDLTTAVCTRLQTAVQRDGLPVLLDQRLQNATQTNLQALVLTLAGSQSSAMVAGSVYSFAPDNSRSALITKHLPTAFDGSLSAAEGDCYYSVMNEIKYENFLRRDKPSEELLPAEVTMGNCMRYIINYRGQRIQNKKTSIDVLDIEPLTITSTSNTSKSLNGMLTEAMVRDWLPSDSGVTSINITHMSTAEFIGKIEDINEKYDMVYFGSSLDGFNTTGSGDNRTTVYNDSDNMNGMLYTSIGDTYSSGLNLTGLLDSDYNKSKNYYSNEYYIQEASSTKFRFSGNDITYNKKSELMDFVTSGFPVIISSNLLSDGHQASQFSVTASGSYSYYGQVTLNAVSSSVPSGSGAVTYSWYKNNGQPPVYTGSDYSFTPSAGSYYCTATITVDGKTYTCKSNTVTVSSGGLSVSPTSGDYDYNWKYLLSVNAPQVTTSGIQFSSSVSPKSASLQWYQDGYRFSSNSTITVTEPGRYYCIVVNSYGALASRTYTVSSGWQVTQNTGGTSVTIPAAGNVVNSKRVDNCSIVYETLSGILSSTNVLSTTEAAQQKNIVLKYLNLSKPSIVFAKDTNGQELKPGEYQGALQTTLIDQNKRTLSYTFTIANPTDGTPASTRYFTSLFMDQNADGRYIASEELTDLQIVNASTGKAVASGELMAGVTYTLTRQLPESFSGIIPWRLEVIKVGSERTHTSQVGYTYLKPQANEMISINILQVTSYSEQTRRTFSLAESSTYSALFNDLRAKGVYDIQINTHTVSEMNIGQNRSGRAWTLSSAERTFDKNGNGKLDTTEELTAYLGSFDMLILGFGDSYGFKENGDGLNLTVANAVSNYIKSGKAILFTHDTTSNANLPQTYSYYPGSSSSGAQQINHGWYSAYYFNAILRNLVGLDRYGVVDSTYGFSKYSPIYKELGLSRGSGTVASGYSGASLDALVKAGYSIAYQPGSSRKTLLAQTQGYTTHNLSRYRTSSLLLPTSDGRYSGGGAQSFTKYVSQVNQGQITTFPYNLNGSSRLSVAQTHEQYYQLNMNSDDIVVWYSLADPGNGEKNNYTAHYNDALNNYYIYNKGNVTYSGAGHFDPDSAEEAKLFVNTMIAAYRAGAENPTVAFESSVGTAVDYFLLPMEYSSSNSYTGSVLVGSETTAADRAITFSISDPNLATNKSVAVEFYYADDSAPSVKLTEGVVVNAKKVTLPIYLNDRQAVEGTSLRSGVLYTAYLSDEVLQAFGGSSDSSLPLYVRVVTTIGDSIYDGSAKLELRKLGLLTLR
ncbi:DUF5057 domain-containing protein [Butyricicoccus sp. Marseille-Q5471]|uniref:DUF5057 domain-containing protein n=1 Tax=Butyricicoccus sp. Marseille-Q5471 TaxID=3039493 RepID=UPI0024BCA907|nr:DUF5057 domain-containing protein [Butyricicoccus sp. Marseille-Q5471]